MHLQHREAPT
jgi:hypothetical protein